MGFFKKRKHNERGLMELNHVLTHSFKNVERDTAYILQWLNYFYHKNLHHEQEIKSLKEELFYTPKSKEDIRRIVDEFYSYEPILRRINDLNERMEELKKSHNDLHKRNEELDQKHQEIGPKLESIKAELRADLAGNKPEIEEFMPGIPARDMDQLTKRLEKLEAKKATIKEKIIKRITKNSKDYVKSIILSYIKKYGKITALQLKEMVVEEQGLCSKSSFYRLLEEIEEEPEIGVIKTGKEKHYIGKITKKNY